MEAKNPEGCKKKKKVNIELGEQGIGGDLRQSDQGKPLWRGDNWAKFQW